MNRRCSEATGFRTTEPTGLLSCWRTKTATLIRAFVLVMVGLGAAWLPATGLAQSNYTFGALPPTDTIAPPSPLTRGALPATVDLRQWAMPVGDQRDIGSCVSWAVAYAMMGWYANSLNLAANTFAPMYVHAQIRDPDGNCNSSPAECGARPTDALDLAINQGIDIASDYNQEISHGYTWPYYPFYAWQVQPTTAQRAKAANYKIGKWHTLFSLRDGNAGTNGMTIIQTALANSQPVAIQFRVRRGFTLANNANDLYVYAENEPEIGSHEVLAVGYDTEGLLIQNSWGTGWGKNGFGRLSWTVVQKDVTHAAVIDQAFTIAPTNYTITASASTGGAISPSGAVSVTSGATKTFTLTPNSGYVTSSVSGTCGGTLSGNTYTTKAITANCTVAASFVPQTYVITASAGAGGSISPSGYLTVNSGSTQTFTLTPNSGYSISSVGGTCGGTLSGNIYTTKSVTASCTVTAAFAQPTTTYTATISSNTGGTLSPSGAVSVTVGNSQAITVTHINGTTYNLTGTCGIASGVTSGANSVVWTTKPITSNCTVVVSFNSAITASAGTGGAISPSGSVGMVNGTTKAFTVTPDSGYNISSVGGTCGGTLSGNTYTTKSISGNCTVTATFSPVMYTVTASAGTGGAVSPSGSISVTGGTTKAFALTPNSGYALSSVGGTCGGTLNGSIYTTKSITGNCTVAAEFVPAMYTITASAGIGGTISPTVYSVQSGTSRVRFTLTPVSGYDVSFVNGTCGGSFADSKTYVSGTITKNCTITAGFVPKSSAIYSVAVSRSAGGTVTGITASAGTLGAVSGGVKQLTLTPDSGYVVSYVQTTCGTGTSSPVIILGSGSDLSTIVNTDTKLFISPITSDCSIYVAFKQK